MGIFDWMNAKETKTDPRSGKEYTYNLTTKEVVEKHPTAGNLHIGFEYTSDSFRSKVNKGEYRDK